MRWRVQKLPWKCTALQHVILYATWTYLLERDTFQFMIMFLQRLPWKHVILYRCKLNLFFPTDTFEFVIMFLWKQRTLSHFSDRHVWYPNYIFKNCIHWMVENIFVACIKTTAARVFNLNEIQKNHLIWMTLGLLGVWHYAQLI